MAFLADVRELFSRPVLSRSDTEEFNAGYRERSYRIATLVAIIGAIDSTVLTILAAGGLSPAYATIGVGLNLMIAWSSPLLLLTLRGQSAKWYPWVICASVALTNGQYIFHVIQDALLDNQFTLAALQNALSRNAALGLEHVPKAARMREAFLQIQIRIAITAFWITALVQLPFAFAATMVAVTFVIYTAMMYLTASTPDFVYATVRLGFIVFLGVMVSATIERRERRLFVARKQYELAQKAAIDQLNSLAANAKQESQHRAEAMLKAFHDLRTPITGFALGMNTYDLAHEKHSELEEENAIRNMREQLEAAGKLADDLFDLAKYEVFHRHFKVSPVSVIDLLDDVIATFKPVARVKKIDLRIEAREVLGCMSNEGALRKVLTNLVSNAIKFTGLRKNQPSEVVVSAFSDDDKVIVQVRDTGIGFSEARGEEIWRYGKTTNGTNKEKGTGIGLPMIRALCDALPSHVLEFDSIEEKGSIFSIRMPKCDVPPAEEARISLSDEAEASLNGVCILLVENDVPTREGEARLLRLLGAIVVSSDSVSAAVRACANRKPDLILTDFHLDDCETAVDVISAVRAQWSSTIPAIVATADTSPVPIEAISALENTAVLKKEITSETLLSAFNRCVPPAPAHVSAI